LKPDNYSNLFNALSHSFFAFSSQAHKPSPEASSPKQPRRSDGITLLFMELKVSAYTQ
jgi:hypothetical protein